MYIWYSPAIPPPGDGDGLKDDMYGGAVTQGKMIPRPPLWVGEGYLWGGCRPPGRTIYACIHTW